MIRERSVEIAAPATTVWAVFSDVARWPEWTESVQRIVPLDGPVIAIGARFEIKQPRLPKIVWEVTDVDPGRSWTWRTRAIGATTVASHEVAELDDGHTCAFQRIDARGPIGVLVAVLTTRLTNRYLELEGRGLKARSEQRATGRAPRTAHE